MKPANMVSKHRQESDHSGAFAQVSVTFLSVLAFLFPTFAFASVEITEVMYNPKGADPGHEWIELTNTGSSGVDLRTLKLFEQNKSHVLKFASGSTLLVAGASAVVVSDPAQFKSDWPNFSGDLFKSSFSLSNTGETIAIKNATQTLDTVSYSSSMGANGDGNSLRKINGEFVAAAPNPGIYPGEVASPPALPTQPAQGMSPSSTSTQAAAPALASTTAPQVATTITEKPTTSPLYLWLLGLGCIIVVGIAGVLMIKPETNTKGDEFEIIND
jgi:hypothetical protein